MFPGLESGGFGKRTTIPGPDGKPLNPGKASAVAAADWDGDGDTDLLAGEIRGSVVLYRNVGTTAEPMFAAAEAVKAAGLPIEVPGGDAGPCVADWDGDGALDLLVGCGDGSVLWYRDWQETGKPGDPSLERARTLVPPARPADPALPGGSRPSLRAKIAVADWDGDGRTDLLVGDVDFEDRSAAPPKELESSEELLALAREYARRLKPVPGETPVEKAGREAEARALQQQMVAQGKGREAARPRFEIHGNVWVFLRRPAEPPAPATKG
ncbi:MAG: VCBS repeat-containing protein [Planctomycetales bacterium]|nr:VCBS repeat-containing protein [Planctomycetales bacterium]